MSVIQIQRLQTISSATVRELYTTTASSQNAKAPTSGWALALDINIYHTAFQFRGICVPQRGPLELKKKAKCDITKAVLSRTVFPESKNIITKVFF